MHFIKMLLIVLIFFVIGLAGGFGYKNFTSATQPVAVVGPTNTPDFAFAPPKNALVGTVSAVSGTVEKEDRANKYALTPLEVGDKVLQGETIVASDEGKISISFSAGKKVSLDPKTSIGLIQLLPESFLIRQGDGTATYEVGATEQPLSVRVQHMLFMLPKGKITVEYAAPLIMITQTDGTGKIGIIDLDNNTHIWDLKKGEKATVNDNTRKTRIE